MDQERVPRLGRDIPDVADHDFLCAVHLEMLEPPVSSSSYSFSQMEGDRSLSFIEEQPSGCRGDSGGGGLFMG